MSNHTGEVFAGGSVNFNFNPETNTGERWFFDTGSVTILIDDATYIIDFEGTANKTSAKGHFTGTLTPIVK